MSQHAVISAATSPNNQTEFTLSRDAAIIVMEDGAARILDMQGDCLTLPRVGAEMLSWTLKHGAKQAAEKLAETYGIELETARSDLSALLADLLARRILHEGSSQPHAAGPVRKGGAHLLASLLLVAVRLAPTTRMRAALLLAAARISYALFGWRPTLEAWRRRIPRGAGSLPGEAAATIAAIDTNVKSAATSHPLGVDCKERALASWALARRAGIAARLVIGVELYPLTGHCWCEVEEQIVSDLPDFCRRHIRVLEFAV